MKGPALLAAALAVPLGLAQTGRPEDPEPAPVPLAAGGERVPEWALGAGVVETMDTVLERAQQRPAREPVIHRMHHDEHGRWEIPSPRHAEYPHSGERYLTVEWGDTRMGLSFGGLVEPRGVWVSGHKSPAVWAPALRAVGYANGEEVARTDWFETIGATPAWFALELGRVDRIEFVARPAFEGAAYYGLDDLTFERPAEGNEAVQPVVLDFEDCAYRQVLTGSDTP